MTIANAIKRNYLITAANFEDWNGLVSGNGYLIKGIYNINRDLTLVKLKNVFKPLSGDGKQEPWLGKFSSRSDHWTEELKEKVNYVALKDQEFFMALEDFKSGFKSFTITYLKPNWKSSFIEKRSSVSKRLYKFNFIVGASSDPDASSAKALAEMKDFVQLSSAMRTL